MIWLPFVVVLSVVFSASGTVGLSSRAQPIARTCGAESSSSFVQAAESHFASMQASAGKSITCEGRIKVYWHVIRSGKSLAEGNIPDSQIKDAIKATNSHFAKVGLRLELASIDRTTNSTWFNYVAPRLPNNTDMKTVLHKGGVTDLNVYTVGFKGGPGRGLLGYATFPWSYKVNKTDDGVVIQYATLPGGTYLDHNQGKTLTHELGHWLGLYHTFQGNSCSGDGDYVDDTPPEETPTSGCPVDKDTCPGHGPDPIHNFMDYSYDACLYEFTPGQVKRIGQQAALYRGIRLRH